MAPSYDKLGAMKNTLMLLLAVAVESTALFLIADNFLNYRLPLEYQVQFMQCLGIALLHWFYTMFLDAKQKREQYKVFLLERIALSLPYPVKKVKKEPDSDINDDSK